MKKVKTAKDIKFHFYTVRHAWACQRLEELGLPPLWAIADKVNKAPTLVLKRKT